MATETQDELDEFKTDFNADYSACEQQRIASNIDLRFIIVPGGQWEGWLEDAMEDRAKLELDLVSSHVFRTYGNWLKNRASVEFKPDDDDTDDEDANLLNGLFRRDLRRANGTVALDVAAFENIVTGQGAFHISTDYDDPEDPLDNRQNVVFEPLHNAFSTVVWDSSSKRQVDKADAKRCVLLEEVSRDWFEAKYPEHQLADAARLDDRREYNWQTRNSVVIATRYDIREKRDTAIVFGHPVTRQLQVVYKSDRNSDEQAKELARIGFRLSREKVVTNRTVVKSTWSGSGRLEPEKKVPGKYIPVIPFVGYASYVDGQGYCQGVVRKKLDGQRLFNQQISKLSEQAARSNQRVPIFAYSQIKGLENFWNGDISRKAYAVVNPIINPDGSVAHVGPTAYLDQSPVDPSMQALMDMTATYTMDATTGAAQDTIDPDSSGKAINAIIGEVDMIAAPLFEHKRVSMEHCAIVYRAIASDIYRSPQNVTLIEADGKERLVTLNAVSVNPKTGQPIVINNPNRGRFRVVADTGPQYNSKREVTVETLKDILADMPDDDPLKSAVRHMLIMHIEGVGIESLRDYSRKQLLLSGIMEAKTDEDKAMLESAQEQEDPQQQLVEAATEQQLAEAENLRASSTQKEADARLKDAKAVETVESIADRRIQRRIALLGQ